VQSQPSCAVCRYGLLPGLSGNLGITQANRAMATDGPSAQWGSSPPSTSPWRYQPSRSWVPYSWATSPCCMLTTGENTNFAAELCRVSHICVHFQGVTQVFMILSMALRVSPPPVVSQLRCMLSKSSPPYSWATNLYLVSIADCINMSWTVLVFWVFHWSQTNYS